MVLVTLAKNIRLKQYYIVVNIIIIPYESTIQYNIAGQSDIANHNTELWTNT